MPLFTRTPDLAERVNHLQASLTHRRDADFRLEMSALRERSKIKTTECDLLARSLALAAEAIRRVFGFVLHEVQIRGASAVAQGEVVQMQTGEGKTLVAAIAAVNRSQ